MGLFDLLTGRIFRQPFARAGMSPLAMGVLGLLAYKAVQSFSKPGAGVGDGIGDWLKKTFGGGEEASGEKGRGAPNAGNVLSGGLRDLVNQFQQAGQGDVAQSWVGTGANRGVTPEVLARVLSEEQITTLMAHTGLSREELLKGMSSELPEVVDQLTPDGHLPSPEEVAKTIDRKPT